MKYLVCWSNSHRGNQLVKGAFIRERCLIQFYSDSIEGAVVR